MIPRFIPIDAYAAAQTDPEGYPYRKMNIIVHGLDYAILIPLWEKYSMLRHGIQMVDLDKLQELDAPAYKVWQETYQGAWKILKEITNQIFEGGWTDDIIKSELAYLMCTEAMQIN